MISILDRLDGGALEEEFPTVAVFILSGAALSLDKQQISLAFQSLLGDDTDSTFAFKCSGLLEGLMAEEQQVVKRIDQEELREALEEQSPNFFTLWERRN